jgi:hypothetical protein
MCFTAPNSRPSARRLETSGVFQLRGAAYTVPFEIRAGAP